MNIIIPAGFSGTVNFSQSLWNRWFKKVPSRTQQNAPQGLENLSSTLTPNDGLEASSSASYGDSEGVSTSNEACECCSSCLRCVSEEDLRLLAKEFGIKNWWNKKRENIIKEMEVIDS
jgi:hypothetical protein